MIVWIDSHPDIGTPASQYSRFHAMHGPKTTSRTSPGGASSCSAPATSARRRGRCWTGSPSPGARKSRSTFDVDTIDSDELVLGLGAEPGGLTSAQARRIVADIDAAADVVGFTIAEFFPRQVMHLQQILDGFPLISGTPTTR